MGSSNAIGDTAASGTLKSNVPASTSKTSTQIVLNQKTVPPPSKQIVNDKNSQNSKKAKRGQRIVFRKVDTKPEKKISRIKSKQNNSRLPQAILTERKTEVKKVSTIVTRESRLFSKHSSEGK